MWLAERLRVGGTHGGEAIAQPEVLKAAHDKRFRRRAGQGHRPSVAGEVESTTSTGKKAPFGFDEFTHPGQQSINNRRARYVVPRVALVPEVHDFGDEHALGRTILGLGDWHSHSSKDLHLRTVPQHLGVDQQAVHVKEGCAQRHLDTLAQP